MTSQTLSPNRLPHIDNVRIEPHPLETLSSEARSSDDSATAQTASPVSSQKLPYKANHQAELLHLQAETEALLHQLQAMKESHSE